VVVEVGCGSLGGFVPALQESGYDALGIDPRAPEGAAYRGVRFEESDVPAQVAAVVACTSLHHVTEPGVVLDKIVNMLAARGSVIIVEWDWESFDEATAQWCFERLGPREGWLYRRRDEWLASQRRWGDFLETWATQEGIHSAQALVRELDDRLQRLICRRGPYFFPDLADTTEADELDAINAGQIRANRIDYVGRLA
jgi:SAM-dependent methyltransferase